MAQKARKDGRVLLSVAMWPEELEGFQEFASDQARSMSEQARIVLVDKYNAWRQRRLAVDSAKRTKAKRRGA